MLWGLFGRRGVMLRGQRYRAEHSAWLTEALAGRCRSIRIPTRPVSDGGFGPMTSRPGGEALARRWWQHAFENTDPD